MDAFEPLNLKQHRICTDRILCGNKLIFGSWMLHIKLLFAARRRRKGEKCVGQCSEKTWLRVLCTCIASMSKQSTVLHMLLMRVNAFEIQFKFRSNYVLSVWECECVCLCESERASVEWMAYSNQSRDCVCAYQINVNCSIVCLSLIVICHPDSI